MFFSPKVRVILKVLVVLLLLFFLALALAVFVVIPLVYYGWVVVVP